LDKEEKSLKQLWFLCQHLNECLKSNPAEGIEVDPRKLVTQEILPVLERIVKDDDAGSLVHLAVQSIHDNKDLKERGVFTEDALICRFDQVEDVCRRVALIDDEGGSLLRFMLSYLQSVLIFDSKQVPREELEDQSINTNSLGTFQILSRIRHHLKNRNLEMSLRYANQLRGEPRRAAMDWIKDVRTHLEVKQAAILIQTHASCVSLKTFDVNSEPSL
jgi:mitofilin